MERHQQCLALLEACGYRRTRESVSMEIDLVHYAFPDSIRETEGRLVKEGFHFSTLQLEQIVPLLRYAREEHGPTWANQLRRLLLSTDDWERVHVATWNGEIVGFNKFGDPDLSIERFGPYGVRPNLRGKGVGKVLLAHCLDAMKKRGIHNCWFQYTFEDSAADTVYKKAGFKVLRRYVSLQKDLA